MAFRTMRAIVRSVVVADNAVEGSRKASDAAIVSATLPLI